MLSWFRSQVSVFHKTPETKYEKIVTKVKFFWLCVKFLFLCSKQVFDFTKVREVLVKGSIFDELV